MFVKGRKSRTDGTVASVRGRHWEQSNPFGIMFSHSRSTFAFYATKIGFGASSVAVKM